MLKLCYRNYKEKMEAQEDDIFDENATEIMIGSRDWQKMESSLTKLGYREGIADGQEINVQEGFNQGYKAAASLAFSIAVLRGEISALLSVKHIQKTDMNKSTEVNLEQLLQDVRELEQSCIKKTCMEAKTEPLRKSKQCCVKSEVSGVTEVSDYSNQCKGSSDQLGCCQSLDVLERAAKTDMDGQIPNVSVDTRSILGKLRRRLEDIMIKN
ncbi:uncharacterized protein [Argopecten irradians]|uniref:uncharacterized protein isoform X1 n=2 Tax=Argopecten irradians TaxID=31199 RepID=UPI00371F93C5